MPGGVNRCRFRWNPGAWPYVRRCRNEARAGRVTCEEHAEHEQAVREDE